jgi:hypothetical protein
MSKTTLAPVGENRSAKATGMVNARQCSAPVAFGAESIGTKDIVRQRGLILEQTQLMRELRLLQEHIAQLESEITLLPHSSP